MSKEPSLNSYLYFETVARRGTLSKAAVELSVSPSAVSQQIKLLEQQMGLRLFRRDGRRLSLTLEGEQLFQASSSAIRILRDARRDLGKIHEGRRLSIRASPSFGVRWLGPRLADFVERFPEWDLRVDAAPDATDFDREVMDVDIRYGAGDWPGLSSIPVIEDVIIPLVSPDYLKHLRRTCETPEQMITKARLINSARTVVQWSAWLSRNGFDPALDTRTMLIDRSSMALQMAADGAGAVLESLALTAGLVDSGALVPMMPQFPALRYDAYWLVCPNRHLQRRAVRVFHDWLRGQAVAHTLTVDRILDINGIKSVTTDISQSTAPGSTRMT